MRRPLREKPLASGPRAWISPRLDEIEPVLPAIACTTTGSRLFGVFESLRHRPNRHGRSVWRKHRRSADTSAGSLHARRRGNAPLKCRRLNSFRDARSFTSGKFALSASLKPFTRVERLLGRLSGVPSSASDMPVWAPIALSVRDRTGGGELELVIVGPRH